MIECKIVAYIFEDCAYTEYQSRKIHSIYRKNRRNSGNIIKDYGRIT